MHISVDLSLPLIVVLSLSWGRKFWGFFNLVLLLAEGIYNILIDVLSSSLSLFSLHSGKSQNKTRWKKKLYFYSLPYYVRTNLKIRFSLPNWIAHFCSWTHGMCLCLKKKKKECLVTFSENSVSFHCCWNYSLAKFFSELDVETPSLFLSLCSLSLFTPFCFLNKI